MLAFSNGSSTDVVVQFSITSEETVISEGEAMVSQGKYQYVETEIDTTGQYELSIEGEGGFESSYRFQIDEYALRMGSNLIVAVDDDGTEIMIEE